MLSLLFYGIGFLVTYQIVGNIEGTGNLDIINFYLFTTLAEVFIMPFVYSNIIIHGNTKYLATFTGLALFVIMLGNGIGGFIRDMIQPNFQPFFMGLLIISLIGAAVLGYFIFMQKQESETEIS